MLSFNLHTKISSYQWSQLMISPFSVNLYSGLTFFLHSSAQIHSAAHPSVYFFLYSYSHVSCTFSFLPRTPVAILLWVLLSLFIVMESYIQHIVIFWLCQPSWSSKLKWTYSTLTIWMFSYRLLWEWDMGCLMSVNDIWLDFTCVDSPVQPNFASYQIYVTCNYI